MAKSIIQWDREARLSEDSRYRYILRRLRSGILAKGSITFIMLNPSTADANVDDNTTRRCMSFTFREGKSKLSIINLFAGRATEPTDLWKMDDPIGDPENFLTWEGVLRFSKHKEDRFVAAWGGSPISIAKKKLYDAQVEKITDLICRQYRYELYCLGKTSNGSPRHPLYVADNQRLELWHPVIT